MIKYCIGSPIILWEQNELTGEIEDKVIGIGVKEKHTPTMVLEGACSYDQILNELLKEDNLI